MALPTLSQTWQFNVNQSSPPGADVLATNRALFRLIKNCFLGQGSWTDSLGAAVASAGNWTVSGSSNSVATGLDGVDRWVSDASLVWTTTGVNGVHSWIVLRQSGISAKTELLIDCKGSAASTGYEGSMYLSPVNGFGTVNGGTNGDISNRPTATDEVAIYGTGAGPGFAWGGTSAVVATRLHVMKSASGLNTRVILTRNGFCVGYFAVEGVTNVVPGWNFPVVAFGTVADPLANPTVSRLGYTYIAQNAYIAARATPGLAMTMYPSGEGIRSGLIGEVENTLNELSLEAPMIPVAVYSNTGGAKGRHASLYDLWFGLAIMGEATSYPAIAPTQQFTQFGAFVFPWNRTTPVL